MGSEGQYGIGSDHWPGLSKLMEEMGELQQARGKLIARGGDPGEHWDGKGRLDNRIVEELGDVRAAMIFFSEANGLSKTAIHQRADVKLERFRFWHQERLGPGQA